MQDQALNQIKTCGPSDTVKPAATIISGVQHKNTTGHGESDADFALLLLDIVKDVIRENADQFLVRPPLFPPIVTGLHAPADENVEDWLDDEGFDVASPPVVQPVHNRPHVFDDAPAAQEIEWQPQYGNRRDFYSTRQLARMTGRSVSRVRRWVKEGKINAVRLGGEAPNGQIFIPKDQLERLKAMGIGRIS